MIRRPTSSTGTDTLFPYTTFCRSFGSAPQRRPFWSGSAPLALPGTDRRAPAFAVDEAALGQVIGRHFDAHGVADDRPDAETPHPARRINDDTMHVFEDDAEAPVGTDTIALRNENTWTPTKKSIH